MISSMWCFDRISQQQQQTKGKFAACCFSFIFLSLLNSYNGFESDRNMNVLIFIWQKKNNKISCKWRAKKKNKPKQQNQEETKIFHLHLIELNLLACAIQYRDNNNNIEIAP